jgi:hypothetical protein
MDVLLNVANGAAALCIYGRYSRGAPATRLAFSALCKFRDNGPNYSLKIGEPELGRGPAFKPFWVWRASNYSAIFLTRRLID